MTRVVAVDPRAPAQGPLAEAAAALRAGALVAFPTETFYGLGAAALQPAAVRRIFDVKGRPDAKPLLVLVDSLAMVEGLAAEIPPAARVLMARHWPGALTLVLRARPHVPVEVTAGSDTVGVRLSAHPVARGLVGALRAPVTAPSANPSGATPPSTADGVLAHFRDRIELVLDGGATAGGEPSTVLDLTVDPPRVLRQGAVRV
ncbi:MAG TPA: L-threonylcarbamoyladenylate synthase [Methylomirabilota bacterium]|nr:L-threonylcarbamoyladenylate synthase [Methylomirabilota bacterium]